MQTIAFTCGDVNGIGPELVLKCLNENLHSKRRRIIFICPKNVFIQTTSLIKPNFKFRFVHDVPLRSKAEEVLVLDTGKFNQAYGKVSKSAGLTAFKAINISCDLLKNGKADAVVTAPISKSAFLKADINFPGHTEIYAERFGIKNYAMMFVSKKFNAALVTIHIPLSSVKMKLTKNRINSVLTVIQKSLKTDFNVKEPKIAVLGLNPHAGENGKIGKEDRDILLPVISKFDNIFGPFVPDAFFGNQLFKNFNCTIGMYHDQILIPFKLLNFNKGVNYTAGLPIVRTSPDHGTAFDIAGEGIANPGSMLESFKYAKMILKNRRLSVETR